MNRISSKVYLFKYLGACKAINAHFYPLIFETSGFIDKSVFDLIAQISSSLHNQAEHIPEFTTWAAPTFKHYWLQRISIARSAVAQLRCPSATGNSGSGGRLSVSKPAKRVR
jgi:hypothetical protein